MKIKENKIGILAGMLACMMSVGCEKVDLGDIEAVTAEQELISMEEVAQLLSCVQLGTDQIQEVYDAVSASQENGYDEEYMLADLLLAPGRGVGEEKLKSSLRSNSLTPRKTYSRPLKALFEDYCAYKATSGTKGGAAAAWEGSGAAFRAENPAKSARSGSGEMTAEDYLRYLEQSGMQIYWPESQSWDGTTAPVVTYAPEDESARSNVGWYMGPDGNVDTLTVDEAMAQSRPVWVINRNDDSPFVSLEVMRKNNPDWETGGNIQIIPSAARGTTQSTMLLLKSFKMLRQYDNWFRGGSEFMIRIGAINSFTASTEAELKLYNPDVTEFMVSVKRKELNVEKQLGVIMVSDWTEQLEDCAFMVTEDDGGTQTSWKCSGTVKINSKSYGFEVTIPLNSYDDIVWRGKLSRKYLRSAPTITGRFGDTEITFATETY